MQTRIVSAIEAATNTLVGYAVSVLIGQFFVYPAYGYQITFLDNAGMTAIFVAASLLRSYGFRRLFSRRLNKVVNRWIQKLKNWLQT